MKKKRKNNKSVYSIAAFGLLLSMGFLTFWFIYNNDGSDSSGRIFSRLDDFGKYAGTNDTKDGIALSACESSIVSPTENQILWHNDPIRFTAKYEHDGAPQDLNFLKWQRRTYGGSGLFYDDSSWTTFCTVLQTREGYMQCPASQYMDFQDSTNFRVARKYDVMFLPSDNSSSTSYPHVNFFTGYRLNVTIGTGTGAATEYVFSNTFPLNSASNFASHTMNTARLNCSNSKENTSDCVRVIKSGVAVTLTAVPGTKFLRWSNGAPCNGSTNRTCSFVMNNDYTVYANFEYCENSCGDWGSCSADCGPGTRSRTCTRGDCSLYTQTESCNNGDCPVGEDEEGGGYEWKEVAP